MRTRRALTDEEQQVYDDRTKGVKLTDAIKDTIRREIVSESARRAWHHSDKGKESQKLYHSKPEAIERRKAYNVLPATQERQRQYHKDKYWRERAILLAAKEAGLHS